MTKLIVNISKATGSFISKNWPVITASASGVIAGVYVHKYQKPITNTAKKTGNGIVFPFTWTYGKVKGLFKKSPKVETAE